MKDLRLSMQERGKLCVSVCEIERVCVCLVVVVLERERERGGGGVGFLTCGINLMFVNFSSVKLSLFFPFQYQLSHCSKSERATKIKNK
jgi:hypothetical protein